MKLYTRTGDSGETGLFGGGRVPKSHLRVEAYGATDELNCAVGLARAVSELPELEEHLERIQNELFHLGAELATTSGTEKALPKGTRLAPGAEAWMEGVMDVASEAMPPLSRFILPGGTRLAAQLHVARTVCRRAERAVVALAQLEPIAPGLVVYLNRLSDLLFTLARLANFRAGVEEKRWSVRPAAGS